MKEEYGKSQLFLDDGTEVKFNTDNDPLLAELESYHYGDNVRVCKDFSFSGRKSTVSYKLMMYDLAVEEAHQQAKTLNDWIRDRMVGSRLPRKKKKWCKKDLSNIISEATDVSRNKILRHFKVKRR